MVVEVYENVENLMKYYKYNGKQGSHFPFNFQLISLYNTSVYDRLTPSNVVEFNPINLKKLIEEWTDQLTDNDWSNWQVKEFEKKVFIF